MKVLGNLWRVIMTCTSSEVSVDAMLKAKKFGLPSFFCVFSPIE